MYASSGQVLLVDLTTYTNEVRKLDTDYFRRYLTETGLPTYLLFDHKPPKIDPLGSENGLAPASRPLDASLVPPAASGVEDINISTGQDIWITWFNKV